MRSRLRRRIAIVQMRNGFNMCPYCHNSYREMSDAITCRERCRKKDKIVIPRHTRVEVA